VYDCVTRVFAKMMFVCVCVFMYMTPGSLINVVVIVFRMLLVVFMCCVVAVIVCRVGWCHVNVSLSSFVLVLGVSLCELQGLQMVPCNSCYTPKQT
jgi:hypothetical protein